MKKKTNRFLSLLLAAALLLTTGGMPVSAQIVSGNGPNGEEEEADTFFSDFILEGNGAVSENEASHSEEAEEGMEATEETISEEEEDTMEDTVSGQSLPEIQTGAVPGPENPVHYFFMDTKFSYIYFGSYPQSEVRDLAIMDAIDKAVATSGIPADVGVDVEINGEKYRRISKDQISNSMYFDKVVNNGYRYFKYEPIKWKVLKNDGETLFLLADNALDYKKYNEEYENVTWETSDIRRWLNDSFYRTAFNNSERNAIVQWDVINEDNPKYGTAGGNNTRDNVYLLSIKESQNEEYGFCDSAGCVDYSLRIEDNAYARAIGGNYSSSWWLRSHGGSAYRAACVKYSEVEQDGQTINYDAGVAPVLHIRLSSDTWTMADGEDAEYYREKSTMSPVASIPSYSSVAKNTKIVLSCATAGADIYYTTDGTMPTMASARYTGEINIDRSMVIRAVAAHRGYEISGRATFYYGLKGEITAPANPVHHCVKAEDALDLTDFCYVYFGSYPQSEVTDSATIAAIDKAIMTSGTVAEAGKDVWVNGIKYRRISKKDTHNNFWDDKKANKGYRYFKWERIKWKVLENDGKTLFVVADKAVDDKAYNEEQRYVTWETSTIRNWLNESFYHTAFSSSEQNAIVAQKVVNAGHPDYDTSGGKDTNDKVYLLSIGEVINEKYGFCSYGKDTISRRVQASDYTLARGGGSGEHDWWLRSPGRYGDDAVSITSTGAVDKYNDDNDWKNGICPALHIDLSSSLWSMTDDGASRDALEEKNITKLSVTGPSKKLAAGKKVKLTLETTPKGASAEAVVWKSSSQKYASVDKNGIVTVKKAGIGKTVTITATARGNSKVKSTYRFKIMKHAVKSIKLQASKKMLKAGKSMTLEATVKTTGKSANKSLKWTSSNKKYATVNSKGKVTAKKAGKGKTVTITAKSTDGSNKKAAVKIQIK